jgi:uncharacterized iron-regulated protein
MLLVQPFAASPVAAMPIRRRVAPFPTAPKRRSAKPPTGVPSMPIRLLPWAGLAFCLLACASRSGVVQKKASANPEQRFWQAVEKADVVYVGETHDAPADHRYELELVRDLLKRKMNFAIGWEMFDRTQQGTIDAWAFHAISLKELLAKTDFQKHWGIYSPVYERILLVAGNAKVPNLALNAPPELAGKIARGEPLTAEERRVMPAGFVSTEQGYRNFVGMMGDHPGMGQMDQRRFFAAQNVWDQTMASRILEFKRQNPIVRLVVFTGRGHVSGGYGIPFYVRQKANLQQLILLPRGPRIGKGAEIIDTTP